MTHHPRARAVTALLPTLLALLIAAVTAAAPSGEEVVAGDVTFHQDGSVTVIHASDGSIIHYDSFDIFANETVQFIQPDETARVLNRVEDAVHVDGTLLANGIVYIVSPLGVFIGDDAVIDVAGLVAAAGNITDEDFLAGIDRFELTGAVENHGALRADSVALLGTRVANLGEIRAPLGTIALVAGDRVVLARLDGRVMVEVDGGGAAADGEAGVQQAGLVDAAGGQVILASGDHYSLAINHDGVTRGADVELRGGDDGVVLVQGEIDASSADQGGAIRVTGDRIALLGAHLDASGGTGGGSIRVGGDVRGEGDLPTARRVYVDDVSQLVADAIGAGDGGSVVVWGDEAAVVEGAISARGGAAGGDGGFAEISSLGLLEADADVDLGADAGRAGTLLFDPQDIVIVGGTDDGSDDPDPNDDVLNDGTLGLVLFGDTSDPQPFLIYESEIEGTDATIRLEARNSIGVSGTFDHEVASEGEGVVIVQPGNSLIMITRNDLDDELGSAATPGIDLGTLEWRTSGGVTGAMGFDTGGTGAVADIAVGRLVTAGGDITLNSSSGSITAGSIETTGVDGAPGAAGGNGGNVRLATDTDSILVTGDIITRGGDAGATGSGTGGRGGAVRVTADDGDVTLGAIDVSGGDGGPGTGAIEGDAGAVVLEAGFVGSGSLTLTGAIRAVDGAGAAFPFDTDDVTLDASDAVEFVGVTGPHITTTESVILSGATVGAVTPIEIEADGTLDEVLRVTTSDLARVDVTTAGFSGIGVVADGHGADFEVTQAAEKPGGNGVTIEIVGAPDVNTIQRIDTTQVDADAEDTVGTAVEVVYELGDALEGDDDVALEAVAASGAITAGGAITLLSEDDVVLEDGAISMDELLDPAAFSANPQREPGTGVTGQVSIGADRDADGSGAILAGGAGVAIDFDDGADVVSQVLMGAGSGIGAAGAPIVTANMDEVSAGTTTSGGIHLRNTLGELALVRGIHDPSDPAPPFLAGDAIVVADAGTGDIVVSNDGGDLLVRGDVRAAGDGLGVGGGEVTLGVSDPDATIRFLTLGGSLVEAADGVTLDGDVGLGTHTAIGTGGDVTFTGAIDTDEVIPIARDLEIVADGVVRFGGDVGSQRPLRSLAVDGATELAQDTSFTTVFETLFDTVDAAADDAAALSVVAGSAGFAGNLGANGRLRGVSIDSDVILFIGDAAQTVEAGADGIALNPAGVFSPPPIANVGKVDGDLRLETTGALAVGPNQKLTVEGTATLVGASVTVGDVSAQAIDVQSDDFQVHAREGAAFLVPGVGLVPDGGPDLIANTISTTSAPTTTGAGNAPIFASVSGAVDGAGAGSAQVLRLERPVASADLVDDAAFVVFDLGIALPDPEHETPEAPPPVEELEEARPGDEVAAGSALPPDPDAVLAFLRCTEAQGEASARECAGAPGSPFDSERGEEIAQRHARIFGPSAEAQAARRLLAGAPDATGRDGVLRDLVALLAQIRLLGIDADGYQRVRDQLLGDALAGASREALLADIRAHARGIPL